MKAEDNIILDYNLTKEETESLFYARELGLFKTAEDDGIDFMNAEYYFTRTEYKFKIIKKEVKTFALIAE
jgi:hypothetical protein